MAKKEETTKIVLERVYNIPLRRQFLKAAKWRRTEKAITALKQFIAKHMKSKDIAIGRYVNKEIWKNGIQNPPHHIKVTATKDEKGRVMVELTELSPNAKRQIEKASQLKKKDEKAKKEAKKEEPKKEESPTEKIEDKIEEATKEKEENAKKIEKKEIKELKKEHPKQHAPKKAAIQKEAEWHPSAPKSL